MPASRRSHVSPSSSLAQSPDSCVPAKITPFVGSTRIDEMWSPSSARPVSRQALPGSDRVNEKTPLAVPTRISSDGDGLSYEFLPLGETPLAMTWSPSQVLPGYRP